MHLSRILFPTWTINPKLQAVSFCYDPLIFLVFVCFSFSLFGYGRNEVFNSVACGLTLTLTDIVDRDKMVIDKFEYDPAKMAASDICHNIWKAINLWWFLGILLFRWQFWLVCDWCFLCILLFALCIFELHVCFCKAVTFVCDIWRFLS